MGKLKSYIIYKFIIKEALWLYNNSGGFIKRRGYIGKLKSYIIYESMVEEALWLNGNSGGLRGFIRRRRWYTGYQIFYNNSTSMNKW